MGLLVTGALLQRHHQDSALSERLPSGRTDVSVLFTGEPSACAPDAVRWRTDVSLHG